jgi:acyl-coenzyme A synthetase/AMP-(fatty) acid ligase
MTLKPGARLRSQVDATEIIIVRPPAAEAILTCGGHPMVGVGEEAATGLAVTEEGGGTQLGKRYTSPKDEGLEVLVTKPGTAGLAFGGVGLVMKEAKRGPGWQRRGSPECPPGPRHAVSLATTRSGDLHGGGRDDEEAVTVDGKAGDFAATLRDRLRGYGGAPFAEFQGTWYSGDDVTGYVDRIEALVREAGVPETAAVGVIVRNRLPHAAALLGFVAGNRSFSMIYAFQSPESMAKDVEGLRPAVVVADREDWSPAVVEAARRVGAIGIAIALEGEPVTLVPGRDRLGDGPFRQAPEQAAVDVLTSGTTGPPKRIQLRMPVLERGAVSAAAGQAASADDPPDLVFWPFGGIGGISQLVAIPYTGKRMILLEKFNVTDWVNAVKRYKITRVGVQPTVIRMLLDAEVPPEDLASLQFVFGGSAPLEPETRERFEKTYGLPVLWAYGATEFAGTLLAWTPDLHRQYGKAKRGSTGKPMPGTEVRVVDPETGQEVAPGEQGYLEARVPLIGPDWIRTTDLASIDEDGFVTLHGRGDGAINRGGFKVLPETVVQTLLRHPAVRDAVVVGIPDPRLGAVPVAAVEPLTNAEPPTEKQLRDFVREHLPAHHVPVKVQVVEHLPRTPSLKVSLEAVRTMFMG